MTLALAAAGPSNQSTAAAGLERLLKKWIHEVWVLEGNSNRLACGNIHVQFAVLGSAIHLKSVSQGDDS